MTDGLTRPIVHIDLDLGDTAVTVREEVDGMFVIDAPTDGGQALVLEADQFRQLIVAFVQLGQAKGWV